MKQLRAIIYLRVSTDAQAEHGTSLEGQEDACLRKAREIGAEVVDVISDEGVSGKLYLSRPGIQKALKMIEAGQADAILTYRLDRSGRKTSNNLDIWERVIERAGAKLIFTDGLTVENNATSKLMFTQFSAFAEYERELIRERTMSGRLRQAKSGRQPIRFNAPFGYRIVMKSDVAAGRDPAGSEGLYVVLEEQAKIVREIFERYAKGDSLSEIRKWLRVEAPAGAKGRSAGAGWRETTVRILLMNPAYKGQARYGSTRSVSDEARLELGLKPRKLVANEVESIVAIECPPLVTEELWNRANERFALNRRMSGRPDTRKLYTGLMICSVCGFKMAGSTVAKAGITYYSCIASSKSKADRNLRTSPCVKTNYNEARITVELKAALEDLANNEAAQEEAVKAYASLVNANRTLSLSAAAKAESERSSLQGKIEKIERSEADAVRLELAALAQGRSVEPYQAMLGALDKEKQELRAALDALPRDALPPMAEERHVGEETNLPVLPPLDRAALVHKAQQILATLENEDKPIHEKNRDLARSIRSIRPMADSPGAFVIELQ